jgi:ATP phosphoribosyltransferase
VDLVESGETMRACGLHPIATLLTSQAVLIRPTTPHERADTALTKLVTSRIRGVIAAARYVLVEYNVQKSTLDKALQITPGRRAPTVSPLDDQGWNAVSVMVLRKEVANVMDSLEEIGACDIFVVQLANCRI